MEITYYLLEGEIHFSTVDQADGFGFVFIKVFLRKLPSLGHSPLFCIWLCQNFWAPPALIPGPLVLMEGDSRHWVCKTQTAAPGSCGRQVWGPHNPTAGQPSQGWGYTTWRDQQWETRQLSLGWALGEGQRMDTDVLVSPTSPVGCKVY